MSMKNISFVLVMLMFILLGFTASCCAGQRMPDDSNINAKQFADLWKALGSHDRSKAEAAVKKIVAGGDRAVAYLGAEFKKPVIERKAFEKLIGDLDAPKYRIRENAQKRLFRARGPYADAFLRKSLKRTESPEVKFRIALILKEISKGLDEPTTTRYRLAIRVLSDIRTEQAMSALNYLKDFGPSRPLCKRAGDTMKEVAENLMKPLVAKAKGKAHAGEMTAAVELLRKALSLCTLAEHPAKGQLQAILDHAVSQGEMPSSMQIDWMTIELDIDKGVRVILVRIPAGKYMMGSPQTESQSDSDESPQRMVRITKPFYMGKYEITQEQYKAVIGKNPSEFKGARNPVERVNWNNAAAFCRELSKKTGRVVRLPTEAEWEYTCRAGTTTPFNTGETISSDQANYNGSFTYKNSPKKGKRRRKTTEVGTFESNAWGLYDMHGNVWEWCADWYDSKYYAKGKNIDPKGSLSGSDRVLRGGGFDFEAWYCRSANRQWNSLGFSSHFLGFRVVVEMEKIGK